MEFIEIAKKHGHSNDEDALNLDHYDMHDGEFHVHM